MSDFIPATTGLSRVFIIEGRAGPKNEPEYMSCYRAQALSQSFGDVTDIECPDPNVPGKYKVVGKFQSGGGRAEITLEGRYAIDVRSRLLRLAKAGCPVDVQIHFGDCEDLSDPNDFKKVVFLEDALLSAYNTEDLGSLAEADTAAVNESVDLSAAEVYDMVPNTWGSKAGDLVTNEVIDGVICDKVSCGDCGDPSSGCNKAFVLTKAAGGSAGTPADVVFSVDGGVNWYAHDIDTLGIAEEPSAIECVKGYLVVVANATDSLHYASLDDFDEFGTDPAWTEVGTGFVAIGSPNDIYSPDGAMAFIVGDRGYIYKIGTPANGATVLDAGTLTISDLLRVHALSSSFAVAVGEDGVIVYTEDGTTWKLLTTPPAGVGIDFTAVMVKSKTEWWVGADNGYVWYTTNAGLNWTRKLMPGDNALIDVITDIRAASDSVLYVSYYTTTPRGVIAASFDGGYSFVAMPLGSAVLPLTDRLNFIDPCPNDLELVLTGGRADNGTDGTIIVATM